MFLFQNTFHPHTWFAIVTKITMQSCHIKKQPQKSCFSAQTSMTPSAPITNRTHSLSSKQNTHQSPEVEFAQSDVSSNAGDFHHRLFSLSQPNIPPLVCSLLRLLNTRLLLAVWRRGLPAPCAVWPLWAVLAVQRGGQGHRYVNPIDHHHKLCSGIRTHLLVVLGLFIRWRKGARPAEERTHSLKKVVLFTVLDVK